MEVRFTYLVPFWVILYFARSRLLPRYLETFQFASLYLLAFLLFILTWQKILPLLAKDFWLIALVLLMGLSTFWSVDPETSFAEFRTSIVILILAGYITEFNSSKRVIDFISFTLGFLVALSFLYVLVGIGVTGTTWRGVFAHQSTLATITGLATISIFNSAILSDSKNKYSNLFYFVLISICLIVIVFSQARTPLVALIASFIILPFFYISKIKYLKERTWYFILTVYFFLITIPSLWLSKEFIIVDLLGKTPDLTGRSHTWELLRQKIFERPLLGYGQGAFWHNESLSREITSQLGRQIPTMYNSHSSYYDCLLNLGFIGFFLLLIIILSKVRMNTIWILGNQKVESQWCLQIILFCLIGGYSDVGYFVFPRAMGWFIINIVSLMSTKNFSEISKKNSKVSENPYLRVENNI